MLSCMRVQCFAEAEYSIKALIPMLGYDFYELNPVEFYCGLRLCAACAHMLRAKDVLTGDIRQSIQMTLLDQELSPDFDRAQLIIISANDLQLLQVEAHYATIH